MSKLLSLVRQHHIIVALRGVAPQQMLPTAQALYDGGIRMLEITFDQTAPDCVDKTAGAIRAVRAAMGDALLVGAGTVLTPEQAQAAVEAGAGYLLTPNLDLSVLAAAGRLGVEIIPGVFTPSEAVSAYHAGAPLVKLFPAGALGRGYIKDLAGPLGHIPLLPMGGVNLDNIAEFLAMPNVSGVGIGSAIAKGELIRAGDFDGLRALARQYVEKAGR